MLEKLYSKKDVFVIAELSANHGNSLENTLETVRAAKEAGADAIKIQTYTPDTITLDCDKECFCIKHGTVWDGTTLFKLYQKAYTPWEWHRAIKEEACRQNIVFFSTPFDQTAVDFLEVLDVPLYKIASFELCDIPLIEYVASKKKPIIMSTGISTFEEIEEAVQACYRIGNKDITLLKCTSQYPALPEDMNLLTIPNLSDRLGIPVGLSDHTVGHAVAIAAVALGARVIEKHFILDRNIGGPDSSFSIEPMEFRSMVNSIRTVEKALGKVSYKLSEKDLKSRTFARSLFICEDVAQGDIFSEKNVRSIRPGNGLHPRYLNMVLGKRATCAIERGTPLSRTHVAWDITESFSK